MERAVPSYLEWQLNVDPSTLRFQHRVQQDFAVSNLPPTTPANRLPTRRLRTHNTTSQSRFCACSIFFFSLFSPTSCAPPSTSDHPRASLRTLRPEFEAPTPSQVLTNTAVHTCHRITLPQPLPSPSLCRHCHAALARLSAHPHRSHAHARHARPVEVGVFVGVRTGESAFRFFLLFFHFRFFFPVLCICAPSRHAPKHRPRAPPPLPDQKIKLPCHREVLMTTA